MGRLGCPPAGRGGTAQWTLGLMGAPTHTFPMPDRSDVNRYRSEAERLIALADSCPFGQYKRPLFEFAAQYRTAARKAEESLHEAAAKQHAPAFRWRWSRRE